MVTGYRHDLQARAHLVPAQRLVVPFVRRVAHGVGRGLGGAVEDDRPVVTAWPVRLPDAHVQVGGALVLQRRGRHVGGLAQRPQHGVDALPVVVHGHELVVRQLQPHPVGVGDMAGEALEMCPDPVGARQTGPGEGAYGIEEHDQRHVPSGGGQLPRGLLGDEPSEGPTAQQTGPFGVGGIDRLGVAPRLLRHGPGLLDPLQPVHRPVLAEPLGERPVDGDRAAGGVDEEQRGPGTGGAQRAQRGVLAGEGMPDPGGDVLDRGGGEQVAQGHFDAELALHRRADPDGHQRVQAQVRQRGARGDTVGRMPGDGGDVVGQPRQDR
ncbi:hypothetical protein SAFG77S_11843 [Streptomyces afghaniensis]